MTRRGAVAMATLAGVVCVGWAGGTAADVRGTFALLSDSASVTAAAGAGSLWLAGTLPPGGAPSPAPPVGPDVDASVPLTISTSDTTSWVLTARVLPTGDEQAGCGAMSGSSLSVEADAAGPRTVAACGSEVQVARGTGPTTSSVVVRWLGANDVAAWQGRVQMVVTQEGGGFSDRMDIPLEVVPPALLPAAADAPQVLSQVEVPPAVVTESEVPSGEPAGEPSATAGPAAGTTASAATTAASGTPTAPEPAPEESQPSAAPTSEAPSTTTEPPGIEPLG